MTRRLAAIAVAPVAIVAMEPPAADDITLTLIRHGQSAGSTSGSIDTSTPGPGLQEVDAGD